MEFVHGIVRRKIKLLQKENQITDNQKSNSMEESVDIKRKKHIFIDRAIEIHQRNEFTINDIVTEANIIVIAGTETTGITLFSVLMYLSMFPQYQERAFEEIYALFPDEKFDVTYEDLENLTFLDMCLNETLRMSPGIPLIARECTKDVPISEGLVISKGTQVLIDIFNMQRDKDVWGPTADTFDPDHFLPSNVDTKNGYAYLPFSKGPRNCIGWQYGMMILKVSLVQVLRKYRFTTKYKFSNLLYINNLALTYKTWPNLEVHRR